MKYILIFVIGGLVMSSCENVETNWDNMTNDFDKNSTTYYIQFLNASAYYETAIDADGLPTNITTTVGVALLGAPQASDVVVTLVPDQSSTMTSSMYTLSSNSITIPAGSTSGSVQLVALADKMPEGTALDLVLNMDAGGAEASSAYQLNYTMKRIKFCPLNDLNDLVGSWSGSDDWGYPTQVVTFLDGDNFMADGFCVGWMGDYWGEVITEQIPLVLTMNPNGTIVIDNQYYMSTTWNGAPQPTYGISGTGKWDNCEKTMIIDYNLHQPYDGDVLTTFQEVISLN
ncbi:MAG: DUF1735 domain-containing protein [Bacteroidota bacterium]